MCGRYALFSRPHAVALQFGLAHEPEFEARYNIPPGSPILVVRAEASHARSALSLQWGLVPAWAGADAIGHPLVNARAEHIGEKPAFRAAFRHRRCIVPANGFFEWKTTEHRKQAYYVRPRDDSLFGIAGIYEYREASGIRIGSCALITTQANRLMASLHERMPAILRVEDYAHWLDPDHPEPDALLGALRPLPSNRMTFHAVPARVNDTKHDDAALIAPAGTAPDELF